MKTKILTFLLLMGFGVALALTPVERKTVIHAQGQLRSSIGQFDAANASALAADNSLVIANRAIAQLNKDIGAAHDREVVLAKAVMKMKPVYDQVTSKWGLGAIAFGIGLLFKHILILGLVILLLGVALYVLSFMFPFIGIAVKAIGVFLRLVGAQIHTLGTYLHFHGKTTNPPTV